MQGYNVSNLTHRRVTSYITQSNDINHLIYEFLHSPLVVTLSEVMSCVELIQLDTIDVPWYGTADGIRWIMDNYLTRYGIVLNSIYNTDICFMYNDVDISYWNIYADEDDEFNALIEM